MEIPSFDDMQSLHTGSLVKQGSSPQFMDQSTQTEYYRTEQGTQTEPFTGREQLEKIHELEIKIKDLENQLKDYESLADGMNKIFTKGQIRKIISPGRVCWTNQDISNALCLHAAGPRAYNHLYEKGFPLPHKKTLQRWCKTVDVSAGLLSASMEVMRQEKGKLSVTERVTVLAFDEMKVSEMYAYDAVADIVESPKKYVQVVIARGLKKSWKQPIFYDFDCKVTPELLKFLIQELYNMKYPVVVVVCDMGPSNSKLWTDLGVTIDKPWFTSPACVDDKVFVFSDVPHLLKLIRNHFLDSGFVINNTVLSSRTIVDLLALTSKSDLSITYKITDEHLTVRGAGKLKLRFEKVKKLRKTPRETKS
ncbi:Transposable element P transposase [Eumeta japonica]|uniref:Transposable element P transposase n=1 Tax=Eumeta variegata TaxID=151549 RepID=A0A4C1SLE0_EUMVA|nr:Transposable element P transposase [Eumeta japonica]